MYFVQSLIFVFFAIQQDTTFVLSQNVRSHTTSVSSRNLFRPLSNVTDEDSSRTFYSEIMIYKAAVCDADWWPAGDSDPYIVVKINDQECGTTTMKEGTNNPTWYEVISCKNYPFKSSSPSKITFYAYDDDSLGTLGDDFIGSGSVVIDTNRGDYDHSVKLRNGNCNGDGTLNFRIHLTDVTPPTAPPTPLPTAPPTPLPTAPPTPLPTFTTEIKIYRASVCDADPLVAGDSDPYVKVKIGNQHCGKTSVKSGTNNPTWNEVISCKNYQFNSASPPRITFDAYDSDGWGTGGDDFIGSGSIVIDTKSGDYDGDVKLHKQDCNEDGRLYFSIHLKQV